MRFNNVKSLCSCTVFTFTALALMQTAQAATILYVDDDAPAGGDGLSWNTAYTHLYDALDYVFLHPGEVSVVAVAQGTYYPDRGTGDRDFTFQLFDDVAVLGGFRGLSGGGEPDDRDVSAFVTTLSGEIGDTGITTDNSYNVVTGSSTNNLTKLGGFTITRGYTGGNGAGMLVEAGHLEIGNCTFVDNYAGGSGGGLYLKDSESLVTLCTFTSNTGNGGGVATSGGEPVFTYCTVNPNNNSYGFRINSSTAIEDSTFNDHTVRALYCETGSAITVSRCSFERNLNGAVSSGGIGKIIFNQCAFMNNSTIDSGSAISSGTSRTNHIDIIDCTFINNYSKNAGGAVYIYRSGDGRAVINITDCSFDQNEADTGEGGALYLGGWYNTSNAYITDTTFTNNIAGGSGGASRHDERFKAKYTNCLFSGNTGQNGGAIYRPVAQGYKDDHPIDNCLFINNTAIDTGGAVYLYIAFPKFTNCAFLGNNAGVNGGAVACYNDSDAAFRNCVFSGNHTLNYGGALYARDYSDLAVENCSFSNNSSDTLGGALYLTDSLTVVDNSILWGNTPQEIFDVNFQAELNYTCINDTWPIGDGNINQDPLFVDVDGADDIIGTEDDNLRLTDDSPAIDAGDSDRVPSDLLTDYFGNSRLLNDPHIYDTGAGTCWMVDMGFHEKSGGILCLAPPVPGLAGEENTFTASYAAEGDKIFFIYGVKPGTQSVPSCPGVIVSIKNPELFGNAIADENGDANLIINIPIQAAGKSIHFQTVSISACEVSNRVVYEFP